MTTITAPIVLLLIFFALGFAVQLLVCFSVKQRVKRLIPFFITGAIFASFLMGGMVFVFIETALEAASNNDNQAAGIIGALILGLGMFPTAAFVGDVIALAVHAIVKRLAKAAVKQNS